MMKNMNKYLKISVNGVLTGKVMVDHVMQNLQSGFQRKVLTKKDPNRKM